MQEANAGSILNAQNFGARDKAGKMFHDLITGISLLQNGNSFSQAENDSLLRQYRDLCSGVFAFNLFPGLNDGSGLIFRVKPRHGAKLLFFSNSGQVSGRNRYRFIPEDSLLYTGLLL